MRNTFFAFALGSMLMLGAIAPNNSASAQSHEVHGPRTIDQELDHLTKELELTPAQQTQIRPLLLEHEQKIQALLDKSPSTPRTALSSQIHAISDQTHHEIETLLTDHQKQLAKAMQAHMHHAENNPPS